jgi:1-acyl-sn-glycerol-3-phosphate acyltransferase
VTVEPPDVDAGYWPWLYHGVRGIGAGALRSVFRLEMIGAEHIPATGPVLLCANHRSNIDSFVLAAATPRHVRYLAKSEVWKSRVLGYLMDRGGMLKLRRGEADRDAIRAAREVLRRGQLIGVFPEGTRNRSDQPLGPAYPGAGLLALEPGVQVVCAAIFDTQRVRHSPGPLPLRFPKITIRVGEPWVAERPPGPRSRAVREVTEQIMERIGALLAQGPARH